MSCHRRLILRVFNLCIVLGLSACESTARPKPLGLDDRLEQIRQSYGVPGVAYAVLRYPEGERATQGRLGLRRLATDEGASSPREVNTIGWNDYFHLGSLSKAITALMAAHAVQDGHLDWHTSFFELFPELAEGAHAGYHRIDLAGLLAHQTGLPPFLGGAQWGLIESLRNQRAEGEKPSGFDGLIRQSLRMPPEKLGDEGYLYSNLSYILAMRMLERASGSRYPQLLDALNTKLGTKIRIGLPEAFGSNQPHGHLIPIEKGFGEGQGLTEMSKAIVESRWSDFVYYSLPSGGLSATMPDYLRFLRHLLDGVFGHSRDLEQAQARQLLDALPQLGFGWGRVQRPDGRRLYSASGSMETFYAHVRMLVGDGRAAALVIFINAANGRSVGGLHAMRHELEPLMEAEFTER